MYVLVSMVFKRRGVLLLAPLLCISGMLHVGSINFDVDLNLKNGDVFVRKRPLFGSGYRSPQVFHRLWPYMEAESNGSCNATQAHDAIAHVPCVKAALKLGSETYSVDSTKGSNISEELVSMKEKSMSVLKEFITKHNVPNDVPDELVESSSEEDEQIPEKPHLKSKKTKLI